MADDEEYCRKYPYSKFCMTQEKTYQFQTFKTDKNFYKSFIDDVTTRTPRRFGVREVETEIPPRRFGVREVETEIPPRRFGVREIEPAVTRRFDFRDVSRPDFRTQRLAKKTSREIQKQREKFLKQLEIGTQEIEHSAEEVLNAYLSQGAYENAFKSSASAERYVRSGSHLIPELESAQVVRNPKYTNNNHTLYKIGNRYIMAYRGSDGEFFNPEANIESVFRGKGTRLKNIADWGTNLHTLAGREHLTPRYKGAVQTAMDAMNEFNLTRDNFSVTGHSLGAGQSDHVAETLGLKSNSFEPARNPFAPRYNKTIHPDAEINSVSTIFDPVSLGRNAYARYRGGEAPHVKHKIIPAAPGVESGWVNQHILEKQHIQGLRKTPEGKIVSTRVTPARNTLSMIGGGAKAGVQKFLRGVGGIANIAVPFALTPEYNTKSELRFRQTEDAIENIKLDVMMSDALFRVNPMFALLDEPAMMATIMDFDPMLPPEAKRYVAKKLGLKVNEEFRYKPPPKIIQRIQSKERRKEEQTFQKIQELSDKWGVPFEEGYAMVMSDRLPEAEERHYAEDMYEEHLERARQIMGDVTGDGWFIRDGKVYYEEGWLEEQELKKRNYQKWKRQQQEQDFLRRDPYAFHQQQMRMGTSTSFQPTRPPPPPAQTTRRRPTEVYVPPQRRMGVREEL